MVGSTARLALAMGVGLSAAGCFPAPTDGDEATDGNAGLDPNNYPNLRIQGEPNDSFRQALNVVFDDSGLASLHGTIATREDVDVYVIGPMSIGDRLLVDVGHGGNLDSSVAIFDESGRLAFENDDRNTDLGQLDPFINQIVRRDSLVYFLAISAAPLGSASTATGAYDIQITITRGGSPPVLNPQTVVLSFAGGTIEISNDSRSPYTVGRFDTADIWPSYAGLTAAVEQKIVDVVRENYEGIAVNILRNQGDVIPGGTCTYSTIYFGGRNPNAYGTSQKVDSLNGDNCDNAIVFTEMFTPSRFERLLSADELGIAIGNVAAHELGHLLGLNHVDNVNDVMDTTGGANTFLFDQEFLNSPLDATIFAFGTQDSLLLLLETLGALSTGG